MSDSIPKWDDGPEAPSVVAVVVAKNPGQHLTEALRSLAAQDYENLSVLVVDAGSDEPIADRVAQVLPSAYLHRIAGDPGWSAAANKSIELVSGSPFLLFCHDDIALDPSCVTALMRELYRKNAGIAGPKLVSWHDERRLLQFGQSCDRFGVTIDQVERGEFDQGQHDEVREVFVIPGGVQLIRADLFTALGGFDPEIPVMGEDLDLCWRTQTLGASVITVPDAKARHLESMEFRKSARERRRLATRHRLRTVLSASAFRSFYWTVPLAVMLVLLESFSAVVVGRRHQARDIAGALWWNLARTNSIRKKRRKIAKLRTVSDSEIRARQVSGSARLGNYIRGQAGQDRFSGMVGSMRSSLSGQDSGNGRDATVITALLLIMLTFGSRQLFTDGVVPVGEIPNIPDGMTMLKEWVGGWRSVGTGGAGNAPSALGLLGFGRLLFAFTPGLFETLVVVCPIFIGAIGVYRLGRPLGSARASAVGAMAYACCPLVSSAMSAGRWQALVVWAAAPFLLASLLKIAAFSPFGVISGTAGPAIVDRNLAVRLIRFGLLSAFVATFAPSFVPVAAAVAVLLAVSVILFAGKNRRQAESLFLAAFFGPIAALVLHLTWSFDILLNFSWGWLVGPQSPEQNVDSMLDLVLFAPGEPATRILAASFIAAALGSLAIARTELLSTVIFAANIAFAFLALAWLDFRGWLGFDVPNFETLLSIVAVSFSLMIMVGVRSIELGTSLNERFAWAEKATRTVGTALFVFMVLLGMFSSLSGRWNTPTKNFNALTEILVADYQEDSDSARASRILWIGDASVNPLDVFETESGIQYSVSDGGDPDITGRWQALPVGATAGIGVQLDLAREGDVVRLGRLLAPYGIDFVVVVQQLAPAPYLGPKVSAGDGVVVALEQQLDLERKPVIPNLTVFKNNSSGGLATFLPAREDAAEITIADQLNVDLTKDSASAVSYRPGQWTIEVGAAGEVLVGVDSDGMAASGARDQVVSGFDGLTVLSAGETGTVQLEYSRRWPRYGGLLAQFVLIVAGALLAQTRRESAQ